MQNRLFVGNLGAQITESELRELFSAHGSVLDVNLVLDDETGQSRGFGFVTMASEEIAQAATRALDRSRLRGGVIEVDVARPWGGISGRRPRFEEGFTGRDCGPRGESFGRPL